MQKVWAQAPPLPGLLGDPQPGPCSLWTSAGILFPDRMLSVPGWAAGRRVEGQNILFCFYRGTCQGWTGGSRVHGGMKGVPVNPCK